VLVTSLERPSGQRVVVFGGKGALRILAGSRITEVLVARRRTGRRGYLGETQAGI
jgi:hypothetical protein